MLLFVLLWAAACAAPVALLAVEVNDQDANATLVSLNPSSGATSPVAAWGGLNGGCIGGHTVRRFAGGLALITVDDSLQTYLTTTDALGRPTGSWPEPPLDTLEVAGGALWTVVTATSKPRNHTVARVSSGGSLHRTTASWPETLFFLPGVSCASATTLYLYGVDGTNLLCAATLAATGAKVLPSRAMPSFIDNISALEFDAAHNRVLALGNNGQGALQLYAFDPVTLNFTGTLVTFASQWGGTTGASALVGGTLYFSAINGDGAMFLLSVAANGKVGAAVALDSIVASLLAPAAPAVVPMSPAAIAARTSTWRSAARVAQRIPAALPKSYDFRLQYPHCVSSILDQGDCGSCWAFASTEVLSDRYCVATGKRVQLSPQYALDCEAHLGCAVGSMPEHAWNYLEVMGIGSSSGPQLTPSAPAHGYHATQLHGIHGQLHSRVRHQVWQWLTSDHVPCELLRSGGRLYRPFSPRGHHHDSAAGGAGQFSWVEGGSGAHSAFSQGGPVGRHVRLVPGFLRLRRGRGVRTPPRHRA